MNFNASFPQALLENVRKSVDTESTLHVCKKKAQLKTCFLFTSLVYTTSEAFTKIILSFKRKY